MSARTGKIARLPKPIREQLNQRLEGGERGKTIVQWLNQLPEVQKVITEQFDARPIREQNLSEWRNGGYRDWLQHQEFRQQILQSVEQADDYCEDEGATNLAERLAYLMTAQLMSQILALNQITDPNKRWEKTRDLARELSRIRRDDQRFARTDLRRQKFEADYPYQKIEEPAAAKPPIPTPNPVSPSTQNPQIQQSTNPTSRPSTPDPHPSAPNPPIQKSINPTSPPALPPPNNPNRPIINPVVLRLYQA